MAADFEGAAGPSRRRNRLRASTGQLRMIRGQIALFSNEYHEAITHLEQAVILEPENVAARALLAMAYLSAASGQFRANHGRGWNGSRPGHLKISCTRDGSRSSMTEEQGLKTLEEAVRRRPSPLAYVERSAAGRTWPPTGSIRKPPSSPSRTPGSPRSCCPRTLRPSTPVPMPIWPRPAPFRETQQDERARRLGTRARKTPGPWHSG